MLYFTFACEKRTKIREHTHIHTRARPRTRRQELLLRCPMIERPSPISVSTHWEYMPTWGWPLSVATSRLRHHEEFGVLVLFVIPRDAESVIEPHQGTTIYQCRWIPDISVGDHQTSMSVTTRHQCRWLPDINVGSGVVANSKPR